MGRRGSFPAGGHTPNWVVCGPSVKEGCRPLVTASWERVCGPVVTSSVERGCGSVVTSSVERGCGPVVTSFCKVVLFPSMPCCGCAFPSMPCCGCALLLSGCVFPSALQLIAVCVTLPCSGSTSGL